MVDAGVGSGVGGEGAVGLKAMARVLLYRGWKKGRMLLLLKVLEKGQCLQH